MQTMQRHPRAERGFTLIEMLVALAVFSLAALTLLRMEGASLSQTADLDQRLVQEMVAQNLAVEWLTDPRAPALGSASGEASNYGRNFTWQREAQLVSGDRLMRITVLVRDAGGQGSAVSLEMLRPIE